MDAPVGMPPQKTRCPEKRGRAASRRVCRGPALEALRLVERLHRRLLDVIKDEFDRRGRSDVNSVQAVLLYNISDKELTAGELRTRGYYLGSNVSYNLKKRSNNVKKLVEQRQETGRNRLSASRSLAHRPPRPTN
jgi:hypothetical protein